MRAVGRPPGWGLTWLTLLGLRQQELSRGLEVMTRHKHQLLELEKLLYVLGGGGGQKDSLSPPATPEPQGMLHSVAWHRAVRMEHRHR